MFLLHTDPGMVVFRGLSGAATGLEPGRPAAPTSKTYWIISVAWASVDGGMMSPSVRAVVMLI
jgi:hypothetical protein